MNKNKVYRSSKLRARLSFNDGYAENPMYSMKAVTSEKNKGMDMVILIQDNFNFTDEELKQYKNFIKEEMIEEINNLSSNLISPPIKLNRDERGNLVSPFASKNKPSWD